MTIRVDGDACPRTKISKIESIAERFSIPCIIYCDISHNITSDYADTHFVDIDSNSADMAIVMDCEPGDIVITNDTGLAAMTLSKRCHALKHNGMVFTDDNIMSLLTVRYMRSEQNRKTQRKPVKNVFLQPNNTHASFATELIRIIQKEVKNNV